MKRTQKKSKRSTMLINRKFQTVFIARFLLINVFILLLFAVLIYAFFNSELDTNLRTAHTTVTNMKNLLMPIIITLSIINILLSSIMIAFLVLYSSHKVAGPMYRFSAVVREMTQGNLTPRIEIRKEDQLYGCMPDLKELSESLAGDFSKLRDGIESLRTDIEKKAPHKKLVQKIDALSEVVKKYGQ